MKNSPDEIGKEILQEVNKPSSKKSKNLWDTIAIPVLAIFTGLLVGGIFIAATSPTVWAAFGQSFWKGLGTSFTEVYVAYKALFVGALGDPGRMVRALQGGEAKGIRQAFNPVLESLVQTTPYIFSGLAVAVGFRSGLFNIGVEGQLFIGAACAAYVGYAVKGLPGYIHMPLAFLAGAIGGAFWAFIPGLLKAKTGGHEVINTIMMNWIAFRLTDWLLIGPMNRPDSNGMPISPTILDTAKMPRLFASPIRFHIGFFIALAVAWLVWWLLFKTSWGLNLRTVGANPRAARYAGLNTGKSIILAMSISGALAGMAGAVQVLAVNYNMATGLSSGYGFDSIALALIGNNNPVGVILASLLFGTLRNGATRMMVIASIPIDIVDIIQAIILMFVAAPAIIRTIYRLKKSAGKEEQIHLSGWGG